MPVLPVPPASSAPADGDPPECTIIGTAGPDLLVGTPDVDVVCGRRGDDVIRGFGGNDLLIGGRGDDRLEGGSGRDGLSGDRGADLLLGQNGGDRLGGGPDPDRLRSGDGNDFVDGDGASDDVGCGAGWDVYRFGDGDVYATDCETEFNPGPGAVPDEVIVAEDTPLVIPTSTLLANDGDPDGDPLMITEVSDLFGFAELVGDDVVYTPPTNECGQGEDFDFHYVLSDGAKTALGEVSVTVTCVYDAPVAVDDLAFGSIGFQDSADVLDNDLNPDRAELSVSIVGSQGIASVAVNDDAILFTPEGENCGNDFWIDYEVTDGVGSDVGGVTVQVSCPDQRPPPAAAQA